MVIHIRRKKTSKPVAQKITRARSIAKKVAKELKRAAKKARPVLKIVKIANGWLDLEDLFSLDE